jgi:hypothetical protein
MKFVRLLLATMPAVAMLAGTVLPAQACKCTRIPYDKVVAQTPVVFDGEVVRAETDEAGLRHITSFRVRGVVKGLPQKLVPTLKSVLKRTPQRTVTVVTAADEAACGYDFTAGPQRLIVGADRDAEGLLVADRCTLYNLNTPP